MRPYKNFNFLKNCSSIYHSGYTKSQFHGKCVITPASPHLGWLLHMILILAFKRNLPVIWSPCVRCPTSEVTVKLIQLPSCPPSHSLHQSDSSGPDETLVFSVCVYSIVSKLNSDDTGSGFCFVFFYLVSSYFCFYFPQVEVQGLPVFFPPTVSSSGVE